MNIERIINMIIRQVTRRLINRGVGAGIDMASRRKQGGGSGDMTPEDRARAQDAKQAAKRARQAARLTRRMR